MKTISDQDWDIIRQAAEKWRDDGCLHRGEHKQLCDALDRVRQGHTPAYAWTAPPVSTQLGGYWIGDPGDES